MAVWKKFGTLSTSLLKKNAPLLCVNRSYLEYDLFLQKMKPSQLVKEMPGPYPTTEEERIKAAEKYGMHPQEYKPLPPDERGSGDYPDLPWVSVEVKDPYYPWDFPALRRNFGEPVHHQFEALQEDHPVHGLKTLMDHKKCAVGFVIIFISSYFFHLLFWDTTPPYSAKQYPGKGVHYTFEPAK